MLSAFVLALREGIEAALIVGIILAVCRRTSWRPGVRACWKGVAIGIGISLVVGLALTMLGASFEGRAEEVSEAIAMCVAAGMITWVIVWLGSSAYTMLRQSAEMQAKVGSATGILVLATVSVAREGLELALFLIAAAASGGASGISVLAGAGSGIVAAILAGLLLFQGSRRLPLNAFFRVTSFLLMAFAAGLVAHGTHEFIEAGFLPAVVQEVWNTNGVLDESSFLGSLLKALFGYNGNPDLLEVLAYVAYWLFICGLFLIQRSKRAAATGDTLRAAT